MNYCPSYWQSRLFEAAMAAAQLSLGLWMLVFPGAMVASSFRFIYLFAGDFLLILSFILIGTIRIAALIANGRWTHGPKLRAICSWVGAALWLQMSLALAMLIWNVGTPPSPGIPVYFNLAIFELVSLYMARKYGNRYR